jgi:aminoglycoside phosphotransferase (APT) family kinase protein
MNAVIAPASALKPSAASPWADLNAAPDAQQLRSALQRGLSGFETGAHAIDAVRVSKVRRSSSLRRNPHPISMLLDLEVRDCASGKLSVQRCYAKAFRDGASAAAFAAADRAALVQPAIGAALSHVEELDMLVWAWPNDPALPQLAALLDPLRLPVHLPDAVLGLGGTIASVQMQRYEPERRATLRCTWNGAGASRTPWVVYAKTFAGEAVAQTLLQRFAYFWKLAQSDAAAPQVAQPLGWDRATRTLWQAGASGQPLMAVASSADALDDFECIGRALAKLHLAALPAASNRSTSHWLSELQLRVQKLSRAVPSVATRVRELAARLEAATRYLPRARQTLIHGDFHPEQVWLNEGRVVFFDFDEFALGNPMEDVAEFSVKLEQLGASPERCQRQVEALTQAYRAAAPRCFNPLWLQWHRAMQTLLQASRAFIYQEPGWQSLVELRLAASESLAATVCLEGGA